MAGGSTKKSARGGAKKAFEKSPDELKAEGSELEQPLTRTLLSLEREHGAEAVEAAIKEWRQVSK